MTTRVDDHGRVITLQTYKTTGHVQRIVRSLEDDGSVYHVELVYENGEPDQIRVDNYFTRIV